MTLPCVFKTVDNMAAAKEDAIFLMWNFLQ